MFQRDEMEANLRPTKTQLQTSKMVQVTVSKKQTSAGKTPQRDKGDTVLQSYREFSELGEEQTILNERIVVEAIFETINNKQTEIKCAHIPLSGSSIRKGIQLIQDLSWSVYMFHMAHDCSIQKPF